MNADHDRALRDFSVACIIFILLSRLNNIHTFANFGCLHIRKFDSGEGEEVYCAHSFYFWFSQEL